MSVQEDIQIMFNEENFESLASELKELISIKPSIWNIFTLWRRTINVCMLLWYCVCELRERQVAVIKAIKLHSLAISTQQQQINILKEKK